MIVQSMTGFGRSKLENEQLSVEVEIKTLNSKYFDVHIKAGSILSDKEIEIQSLLIETLERGKVTFFINFMAKNTALQLYQLNTIFIHQYYQQLKTLAADLEENTSGLLESVVRMPEATVKHVNEKSLQAIWPEIFKVIKKAIKHCQDFRKQEGKVILNKLLKYTEAIEHLLNELEQPESQRAIKIKEKLCRQLAEFIDKGQYDDNRLEQELIYYIEKIDIQEEKVRLRSHLKYMKESLEEGGSIGKKLGFIAQEIGREINTIGAKANDANMQRLVVSMKEELEKIKEQSFNLL